MSQIDAVTVTPGGGNPEGDGKPQIDWGVLLFLSLTPLIGIAGTALYTWIYGFELWMGLLALVMYLLVGLSICSGYHRFFSHKSYECSPSVQMFYAIFGAMAAQNSILLWSASHRVHHQYVDRDWDPYNIKRGFWWAHVLWVFYRHPAPNVERNAPDLLKNPVVMWQHRWYKWLLIAGGFGLPTMIGWLFGHPIAGLLWGGFLRLVVIHHTTFFVNSLAHYLGEPRYDPEISARDNWAVALLTLGEGYHSFHHRFPADFRNGIHWYQWDPAKWFILGLKWVGLASDLRATPPPHIQQARVRAQIPELEARIESVPHSIAHDIRRRMNTATMHLEKAFELWREHLDHRARNASAEWRRARRQARDHMRQARREWKRMMRILSGVAQKT